VVLDDILEKLPENFDIQGVLERLEEKGPFGNVFLQECYYMNTLLTTMRSSLRLLDLALKGDITFTDVLESTMMSLHNEQVPEAWRKVAYPSVRRLGAWFSDLLRRVVQLDVWVRNLIPPKVVWISGFFNPQAFLTAIMQTAARKNSWPLATIFKWPCYKLVIARCVDAKQKAHQKRSLLLSSTPMRNKCQGVSILLY